MVNTKKILVKLTHLNDFTECDTCGGNYASGWRIECEEHPKVDIELIPRATCYGDSSYDYVEDVFRVWLKNGVVLANAPQLSEEQVGEWDFMRYLMPDMYKVETHTFYDAAGDLVAYDEASCKVTDEKLIEEYLSRVLKASVHVIPSIESLSEEIDLDEEY